MLMPIPCMEWYGDLPFVGADPCRHIYISRFVDGAVYFMQSLNLVYCRIRVNLRLLAVSSLTCTTEVRCCEVLSTSHVVDVCR